MKTVISVTENQLDRYPRYLSYLKKLRDDGVRTISSPALASVFHCSEDQIRKDFQAISASKGKPKTGRDVQDMIDSIESFLGYHNTKDAVIIGVGHLGTAFLNYQGFEKYGIHIIAGFDNNPALIGQKICGKMIFSTQKMENLIPRLNVRIGVISLPASETQAVVDTLVRCGIRAIWNFAPVHLEVPEGIIVETLDLAASLSILSQKLAKMDEAESANSPDAETGK